MRKKRKHPILLILLVLLVLFLVWLFWPIDDDYYDDDYDYYNSYSSHYSQSSGYGNGSSQSSGYNNSNSSYSSNSSGHGPSPSHSSVSGSSSGSGSVSNLTQELPDAAVRPEQAEIVGGGKDTVTVLIYMNGSDLESDDGSATADLQEMIAAGSSDKVNVVVQTMGTKKWSPTFSIASNRSQIYEVSGKGLKLVKDDLGQLDATAEKTLKNFVTWGQKAYPADRYILLLWDHGGGPVYGFGYDQFQAEDAALTIDEIRSALKSSGVYFDFIGFDACLMSSLEVCASLYDACDYTILSEDFEPGIGWYYTDWLQALYKNTSISVKDLGKVIVDSTIRANQTDPDGDECILALVDQGMMKVLYTAWVQFAYANEDALLGNNYSRQVRSRGRTLPRGGSMGSQYRSGLLEWLSEDEDNASLEDYYIADIMALASTINSQESAALSSALNNAIVYVNSTSGVSGETGISVTLPYGDSEFYDSLKVIFTNCGIDADYIAWLKKFTSASGSTAFYNYDSFDDSWDSWDDYDDDYDWSLWDLIFGEDFWEEDDDDWGWGYDPEYSHGGHGGHGGYGSGYGSHW